MLESIGKIYPKGKTLLIYVPVDIVTDSQFPLPKEWGKEVKIIIRDNKLIIEKENNENASIS